MISLDEFETFRFVVVEVPLSQNHKFFHIFLLFACSGILQNFNQFLIESSIFHVDEVRDFLSRPSSLFFSFFGNFFIFYFSIIFLQVHLNFIGDPQIVRQEEAGGVFHLRPNIAYFLLNFHPVFEGLADFYDLRCFVLAGVFFLV